MSKPFLLKNYKNTIAAISKILLEIIEDNISDREINDSIAKQKDSPFNAKKKPVVEVKIYLERIVRYTNLEESTLVLSLIYIDQLCSKNDFILTPLNIHRVLFVSILCAIKYNEDDFYANTYYAKVAGISGIELNNLEYEFLKYLDFGLYVTNELFCKYHKYLKHYRVKKMNINN
jgi:hypothetical protein